MIATKGEIETISVNRLVALYLVSSFAYYHLNASLLTDDAYDRLCERLDAGWFFVTHPHAHLVDRAGLKATTAFALKLRDYPLIVQHCAMALCERHQVSSTAHYEESMSTDNINIVQIEAASGIPLTAAFVRDTLGITPVATDKRAVFWHVSQWPQIAAALAKHVANLTSVDPRSFSGQRPKKDKPGEPAAAPAQQPAAQAPAASGFNFGAAPATTSAPAAGGFNFGAAPAPASAPAAAPGFTF